MPAMPDISDLASRLRFNASEGRIWLEDQRMILLHVSGFAALRKELIAKLGTPGAAALLHRTGFASGSADAVLVRKVRPERSPFESFMVGPQLHMLEGVARVDPVRLEFDIESGDYDAEFLWRDSAEADAHLSVYDVASEPSCWMQTGYADGYTSAFMGRAVQFREVECRAMGHPHCRIVGKTQTAWQTIEAKEPGMVSVSGLVAMTSSANATRETRHDAASLIGNSPAFMAATHRLDAVSGTNTTVLLLGETGVGKERFARRLHDQSMRAKGPFVAVNCSAIPANLVEAELFGVVKGAYTGASESRPGRFERANGGSLFLDELGTLSRSVQAKLLRAIQERQIERVGSTTATDVDVRVIAATNEDLRKEVKRGRFRADLYYRVAVFPIRIPTLRERRADIPRLVEFFVDRFSRLHGRTVPGLSGRAVNALLDYGFPGNVRELENMVERAVILAGTGNPLDVGHFFEAEEELLPQYLTVDATGSLAPAGDEPIASDLDDLVTRALDAGVPVGDFESRLLEGAVARANGNLSLAAKSLGITRPQLAYRLKKLAEERSST